MTPKFKNIPNSYTSFVAQHAHDTGADRLGRNLSDVLGVRVLHVDDQHHPDQSDELNLSKHFGYIEKIVLHEFLILYTPKDWGLCIHTRTVGPL
jgi:hypothetical protein